ncbi:hypothetical protein ACHAW5_009162 [Stephanodiscus triporus]|uniref:Uncharacterized protein n=1 Tax=Stephanodiscus triporus TaxID=2934178 RepID=A0ABD3N5X5_9STRA
MVSKRTEGPGSAGPNRDKGPPKSATAFVEASFLTCPQPGSRLLGSRYFSTFWFKDALARESSNSFSLRMRSSNGNDWPFVEATDAFASSNSNRATRAALATQLYLPIAGVNGLLPLTPALLSFNKS